MFLQLFWGAPALHRLCLNVSSAVGCGNWSVRVGACSPLVYLKTRSLSLCCILLRDSIQAGREILFRALCKSLWEDQNSHTLLSQHLADCLNSLCTTRIAHEAPNLSVALLKTAERIVNS